VNTYSYHLVGIGGAGMSALGYLLALKGFNVTGSDRANDRAGEKQTVFTKLKKKGIKLFPQDGSGITAETDCIVISTAIEEDNADIQKAKMHNIPIKHRTDILKEMSSDRTLIGITGTAGKTTVTGIIGWILERTGFAPTVVNGGETINWVNDDSIGSTRLGKDDLWVLELDESDKTLLKFSPDWAVITNITKDHFEIEELNNIFCKFVCQVKKGIITSKNIPQNCQISQNACGSTFSFEEINFDLQLLGEHNIQNAILALMMCKKLGVNLQSAAEALSEFKGIKRRLEIVGKKKGITVIDDYAHNPAKITASIKAVKPFFKKINAVWRPHGFAPLKLMLKELAFAFSENLSKSDSLFLLPVYYAGGTASKEINSNNLQEAILQNAPELSVRVVENYDALKNCLLADARDEEVILLMGARDPALPLFAEELLAAM
jgi:UDP-N-acetylmuramate--alanine ligase